MSKENKLQEFSPNDKPSEKFHYICMAIAKDLLVSGFKYRKSSSDIIKRENDFTYIIKFVRTRKLNPVVFNVYVSVQSDILKNWRQKQQDELAVTGEIVKVNLASLTKRREGFLNYEFRTINDAKEVIDDIVKQIKRFVLPFFKRFQNLDKLLNELNSNSLLSHHPELFSKIDLQDFIACFSQKNEPLEKDNQTFNFGSYQAKIKKLVFEGRDIEDYKDTLLDYKNYLEKLVKTDKSNSKAVNQLAIVYTELYEPYSKALELLECMLNDYEDDLTKKEKVELYTNLAMLYDYDIEQKQPEQALLLLEEVVGLKPKIANPYNALGVIYAEQEQYEKALGLFKTAIDLDEAVLYKYNYAVCLCRKERFDKAITVLKSISADWRLEEDAFQAYYLLGYCYAVLKDYERARDIADDMSTSGISHSSITAAEIAGLYYMCGEYKKHNNFFDKYKKDYYISVDWLACYFYSLCQLNQDVKDLLFEFIEQKQNRIEELEQADFSQIGEDVKREYIEAIDKEIVDISKMYHKVTVQNIKPQIKGYVNFLRKCYFIDCPVHSD